MKDKKYVVVDLETTGTKIQDDNRTIQFAAVVIVNQEITEKISFLINPHCEVNSHVVSLTGITNQQLVDQPDFSHFAAQIWELLQDCTFVAHNVDFDYPFLQAELAAAGYPLLDLPAIDTVELAQVLLPTAPSFKLSELTTNLKIMHSKPHQADSDALATAKLFLYLQQKIEQLPNQTLRTLQKLAKVMTRQTGDFLREIAQQTLSKNNPLADDLVNVQGLVLKRLPSFQTPQIVESKFPNTKDAKTKLFNNQLQVRDAQSRLMNFINRKLTQKTPLAIVDAPTGFGKTLGYLLPVSYQLDQGNKVVIATATKLLQQQIVQEDLPLLSKIRQQNYTVTVISSPHDYLDMNKFRQLLFVEANKQITFIKMRIVVWLTQTTTGNLQELNLSDYDNNFFRLIRSHQHTNNGLFGKYNFWTRLQSNARRSDLVITNQAFLLQHANDDLWGEHPALIIDEASSLLQQTLQPQFTFSFKSAKNSLKKISDTLYQNRVLLRSFFKQSKANSWTYNNLEQVKITFDNVQTDLNYLTADLISNYIKKQVPLDKREGDVNLHLRLSQFNPQTLASWQRCENNLQRALEQVLPLFDLYQTKINNAPFLIERLLYHVQIEYLNLWQQQQNLQQILSSFQSNQSSTGMMINMWDYHNWDSLAVMSQKFNQKGLMKQLQQSFSTCILIGAALKYQNSLANFSLQLGIDPLPRTDRIIIKSELDLTKQLKSYLPIDALYPQQDEEFVQQLAKQIYQVTRNNHLQTLVMFNSLHELQAVHELLLKTDLKEHRELLAQSASGSSERLKKRFALNKNTILLATNSFGTGVNLAPRQLKLVIVTRLPFESIQNPFVQAKNSYWEEHGKNPFKVESLPTVVRRLKQQVGRLIRHPQDHGAIIFLDQRLKRSGYGSKVYQELQLPELNNQLNLNEIAKEIKVLLH